VTSIVVVDDDRVLRDLFEQLFRERGWDVVVVPGEVGAFDAIRAAAPSLVVLDIRMERRASGWTILERLQGDPTTVGIPVMICTAAEDDTLSRRVWLEEHGIPLLLKPFDIERLYALVERLVCDGGGHEAA
jgi:CheY-like chemotaxis protein